MLVEYPYDHNARRCFNHTVSCTYDNVNRLTQATATGNSSYSQTYAYGGLYGDGSNGQYGNMTCTTGCNPAGGADIAFYVCDPLLGLATPHVPCLGQRVHRQNRPVAQVVESPT